MSYPGFIRRLIETSPRSPWQKSSEGLPVRNEFIMVYALMRVDPRHSKLCNKNSCCNLTTYLPPKLSSTTCRPVDVVYRSWDHSFLPCVVSDGYVARSIFLSTMLYYLWHTTQESSLVTLTTYHLYISLSLSIPHFFLAHMCWTVSCWVTWQRLAQIHHWKFRPLHKKSWT